MFSNTNGKRNSRDLAAAAGADDGENFALLANSNATDGGGGGEGEGNASSDHHDHHLNAIELDGSIRTVKMTKESTQQQQQQNNSGLVTDAGITTTAEKRRRPPRVTRSDTAQQEDCDVIGDLIGHYGKWQLIMTVLLSLFQIPNTFHISSPLYQAAAKEYWCEPPAHLSSVPGSLWKNVSQTEDGCRVYDFPWNNITAADITSGAFHPPKLNTTKTTECHKFVFSKDDNVGNTWTSEWDLVCDNEVLKNVAEMFFLLGVATGGIVSGYLSDKFGRKKMLFISVVLQTIFGFALYFAESFRFYLALRTLLGIVSVSVTYAGLILAIEYVDGKWRTIAGMYNLFPLPISYMVISGIAYLTQDYKTLQLIIGIPGIFLCFLWFVVPESPRWLLCKGRVDEVKEILQTAARMNKMELPQNLDKILKPPNSEKRKNKGFTDLFRSKYLRLVSICFLCIWFTMNLVYYGLILNMNALGGNIYINSALAGLVEMPAIAIAIFIIGRIGQKWLFCATFFCAGLACLCATFVEGESNLMWLKITFVMIGKFTISAGNTIMPVYTAELYPTSIRNVGVGACNVAAGLALILTPYLDILVKIEAHLLMAILTAWCIFGGIVVIFLPEYSHRSPSTDCDADEERN